MSHKLEFVDTWICQSSGDIIYVGNAKRHEVEA